MEEPIKFIVNESDDWQIKSCGGLELSSHRLDKDDFIELLKYIGHEVEEVVISDEEMEEIA